ncbi:MAG: N-acetylglucosamine-6-phosphate deacetylase [Sediminicola sp.]
MVEGIHFGNENTVSIAFEEGKISKIEYPAGKGPAGTYLAPGLIDLQINGYMGVDFSGPDLTVEGIKMATKGLWKAGVTAYFPTVITSDPQRMKKNFTILAQAKDDPEIGRSIVGFHLEGPYISPIQGYRGAHLEKYTRDPDWEEFVSLQKAARGHIKLITLAPELKGAVPFIKKCVASGVTVSLGHHNASAGEIKGAVDAGARMATHLGNGCANRIDRHDNPLWPQLSDDRITPSIIADGFHLTKEEIRSFYKVKGPGKTILVSDALDLAGLPPGKYIRGERELLLTPNVVKLPKENVLAGAATPLVNCLKVIMEYTGCSLSDAIGMASTNPARMLSLDDRGRLEPGARGDLILFNFRDNGVIIQKTYVSGELVYERD